MMFSKVFGNNGGESVAPELPEPEEEIMFRMPSEDDRHEGTWLQWPHNRGKNKRHDTRERYEESWIQMTVALHGGERVHIIVWDPEETERVSSLLKRRGCDMSQIDFYEWPTDDVWIRDNGPIFVFDNHNKLHITNWGFNGWGKKAPYENCNQIPKRVAKQLDVPITTVPMINEGGSIEIDGKGTMMAKKSSILNRNRNKGWTQDDAEAYFHKYLGIENFIWLDGCKGGDITDDHIDGTARFADDGKSIVTFYREDFLEPYEYDNLKNARNVDGERYNIVCLPTTSKKVTRKEYGFYINFYVANEVVLMPSFDEPEDDEARAILQDLYSTRRVVKIPMREVLKDGGMVHCVTQQQPEG